jgi:hypothetical protein
MPQYCLHILFRPRWSVLMCRSFRGRN